MSQSVITLGIGGTSDISWLVLTGLHCDGLTITDSDNFAYVLARDKQVPVTARNKRALVPVREKRAIVEK